MAENSAKWLLYGAYGYTGKLLIEEAVQRGHRPILGGRSEEKLKEVASAYGLDYLTFDLSNTPQLEKALEGVDMILLAAGPFVHTSEIVIQACLKTSTHYADITGEIPVFQKTFSYGEKAMEKEITLMSGVGFDVIPTDCLANYVAEKVPDAQELYLAFCGLEQMSAGTAKTVVELFPSGTLIRKNGQLQSKWPGTGGISLRILGGKSRTVVPLSWGDLETAYHSTGIPNITAYTSLPGKPWLQSLLVPLASQILKVGFINRALQNKIAKSVKGPSEDTRKSVRTTVWAKIVNADGKAVEAWLDTPDGYTLTAIGGVRAVEKILELNPKGALTPSQAFGADFVLELGDTKRFDQID